MAMRNAQPMEHHIVLKRHHKIMIGGVGSLVIIILIINSFLLYTFYGQLQLNYNELKTGLSSLEADTSSKINELSSSLLDTKQELSSLDSNINQEISQLKASASSDFSGIIDQSIKGVVTVKTDISQGTGFIITDDGYIVTNYHVIEGAKAASIYTYDGVQHSVSLMGYDSNLDIALLKIGGSYNKLALSDSNDVQIGEKVIAIGNPLGLQFSASEGIVSAVNRQGPNGLDAYIQTDAALNPGNSGGPLIDTSGKVIGINNYKVGNSESIGFALESNYIKEAVNGISEQGLNETLI
jgi:S1-C subfamily serine protease